MDTVVALGNGFDISLGLATRYSDFLKSKIFFSNHFSNGLFDHLVNVKDINGWIDFEHEIYEYALTNPDPKVFKQELQELCNVFHNYLRSLDLDAIDRHSHAFKFLGHHLSKRNGNNKTIILNFNFTGGAAWAINLVKRRLGADFNHNYRLIYVHGSVADEDLIFGVNDYVELPSEYHFIKKSANRLYKPTDVHRILKTALKVNCYGLSLGESDHTYFKEYILNFLKFIEGHQEFKVYNVEEAFDDIHYQLGELTDRNLSQLRSSPQYEFIDVNSTDNEIDWQLPGKGRIGVGGKIK